MAKAFLGFSIIADNGKVKSGPAPISTGTEQQGRDDGRQDRTPENGIPEPGSKRRAASTASEATAGFYKVGFSHFVKIAKRGGTLEGSRRGPAAMTTGPDHRLQYGNMTELPTKSISRQISGHTG